MTRRARAVATAMVAGCLLMACGTGDETGPASTGTGPTTTMTASTDPATTTSEPSSDGAPPTVVPTLGAPIVELEQPVDLAVRPGDDTLFFVERPGRVRAVRDGQLDPEPVLDISDLTRAEGERGLLGLAFSPDGRFAYVNYTDLGGTTIVAGYPIDANGRFDRNAGFIVYELPQPFPNHNGGAVLVGPDGMLYLPTGDGGSGGDPLRVALDLASPLGKILRIEPVPGGGYRVPSDNPFIGRAGALPEIWSIGLRNPWRASFDRLTGDLWVADVGQNAWEEVSVAWADEGAGRGVSFGWSAFEGTHRFHEDQIAEGHLPPVFEYPHGDLGCSVSGGVRYRGPAIPALTGHYVFGDFCSGLVWALPVSDDRSVGQPFELGRVDNVSAVAQGPDGEIYVLSLSGPVLPVTPNS